MDRQAEVRLERAPSRCPQCHDDVAEDDYPGARVCERCLARHHGECWGGRCGACACPRHAGQAAQVAGAPPAPVPRGSPALAPWDPPAVAPWGALADHPGMTAARRVTNALGALLLLASFLAGDAAVLDPDQGPSAYLRGTLGGWVLSTLALACVLNAIHARGRPPTGCWARCGGLILAALPWTTYLYFAARGWRGPPPAQGKAREP